MIFDVHTAFMKSLSKKGWRISKNLHPDGKEYTSAIWSEPPHDQGFMLQWEGDASLITIEDMDTLLAPVEELRKMRDEYVRGLLEQQK